MQALGGAGLDGYEMVMACLRAVSCGLSNDLSEDQLFDAFAELIQAGAVKVYMHYEADHIGASLHLATDKGIFVLSHREKAIDIRSIQ